MKAGEAALGFDPAEGYKVTLGGIHTIVSAPSKSPLPPGSRHRLELVPIKGIWFSNHLVSDRPERKP